MDHCAVDHSCTLWAHFAEDRTLVINSCLPAAAEQVLRKREEIEGNENETLGSTS